MLSMRTGPVADGTVSRPISLDVAALALEDPDLDGILLLPFLVERDLVVSRDRQPQHVADRRHPHAKVGGALAVDRDVDLRIRDIEADLDLGQAGQLLPAASARFEYSAICFRSGPRMLAEIANPPVPSPLPSAFRELMLGR